MAARRGLQCFRREGGLVQRLPQRRLDAVKVAVGVGAGFGGALAAFAQADLVLGRQRDAAQRKAGVGGVQAGQGGLGGGAGGAAGGQVKDRAALPHRLERREQHADGLADAGGRLAQQLPAPGADAVDLADHGLLAGAVTVKREAHGRQAGGALFPPGSRPPRPGGVLLQQAGDDAGQLPDGVIAGEAQRQFLVHLIIGQLDAQAGQVVLHAVDKGVDLPLGPVFRRLLAGDGVGGQGGGLDLVDGDNAVRRGEDAVGPALDGVFHLRGGQGMAQRYLGGVVGVGGDGFLLQFAVQTGPLQRPVKTGEPVVDAAGAQQKLHQLPDRQRQGQCGHGRDLLSFVVGVLPRPGGGFSIPAPGAGRPDTAAAAVSGTAGSKPPAPALWVPPIR